MFQFERRMSAAQIAGRLPLACLLLLALVAAGCNAGSLSEGLETAGSTRPSESVGSSVPLPGSEPAAPVATQPAPAQGGAVASLPQAGSAVAFLPVSNAPQGAVANLASSIRSAAARNGVTLVASVEQGAQYQVKGYFSALEDGGGTLLVYVWDILDRNNKRVYRINGQEQTNQKATDPWSAVTPEMIDRVAQSTLTQLRSWLGSRG